MELMILLTGLLSMIPFSVAYPFGAPTIACNSMRPLHLLFRAQDTRSPFITQPEKAVIDNQSRLNLSLYSLESGTPFKGYMLLAFDADSRQPVGSFIATRSGKIQSCLTGYQNMVTHSDSEPKYLDVATWLPPPNYEGRVVFETTFVQGFRTFWTRTPSAPVQVVRRRA